MTSGYKQFTNEGCGVEGDGHDTLPSYDESNAISSSVPPQSLYQPQNSSEYPMQQPSQSQQASQFPQQQPDTSGYPMQQPSQSQQASQFPQQQPGTYAPQLQVIQVPVQQNIVHVSMETTPNDYFGLALFVTLCCCLPFGIVALIKSNEVKNRSAVGDYRGAAIASSEAKRWSKLGLTIGCVILFFNVLGGIAFATMGPS